VARRSQLVILLDCRFAVAGFARIQTSVDPAEFLRIQLRARNSQQLRGVSLVIGLTSRSEVPLWGSCRVRAASLFRAVRYVGKHDNSSATLCIESKLACAMHQGKNADSTHPTTLTCAG